MKYALSIAAVPAVLALFMVILLKGSLDGIMPVAILAVVFVGLLVARKIASSRSAG